MEEGRPTRNTQEASVSRAHGHTRARNDSFKRCNWTWEGARNVRWTWSKCTSWKECCSYADCRKALVLQEWNGNSFYLKPPNLDSVLKSRDITSPTKVHILKAMVFSVVMYGCESWTVKKAECWKRPWCWERLKAGGKGGNTGWDGWMASPTQWTCIWVNFRR